jgi:starvation-inducible outer membrane lipoprotein
VRLRACAIAGALLLAACDSKPLDWNTLAASRIRNQVPAAQITVVDTRTLEANLGGKITRIDTAELQLLCNRGPKDCDYAFDQAVIALRGPAQVAPK